MANSSQAESWPASTLANNQMQTTAVTKARAFGFSGGSTPPSRPE